MARMTVNFFSASLGVQSHFCAFAPQNTAPDEKLKVLYLLHGLSDDCTMWGRNTQLELFLAGTPLLVITPEVHRSYYADMKHGGKYWQYVSEELPQVVQSLFHASPRREDTFVAGLSMGGYGALKLALNHPDRFGACAAFSSAVDPEELMLAPERAELLPEFRNIFGSVEELRGSCSDLFAQAQKARGTRNALPRIRQFCGNQDYLLASNRRFRDHLEALQWPDYGYEEWAGAHTWDFWNECLPKALTFFLKK